MPGRSVLHSPLHLQPPPAMLLPTLLALASPIQTPAWTEEVERNAIVRLLTSEREF